MVHLSESDFELIGSKLKTLPVVLFGVFLQFARDIFCAGTNGERLLAGGVP